jgi:hypothetical protein
VSGWQPGGERDEVSFGPDEPTSSPGRPRALGALGLLVGVLIGGILGAILGIELGGGHWSGQGEEDAAAAAIVAGAVVKVDDGDENGPAFGLQLHNGGDESVEITDIRFDDLPTEVVTSEDASLAPGVWESVQFAAPADCLTVPTDPLERVRLTLDTPGGERVAEVPLPGGAQEILDYHAAMCAPQSMPEVDDLAGVWLLEEAYGSQFLVGSLLWRFEPNGRYTGDPEGLMFLDVPQALEGRYSLKDGRLRLDIDRGYGCGGDRHSVWSPSLMPGSQVGGRPRMTVAWLAGDCPAGLTDQVWVFRRLLDDAG